MYIWSKSDQRLLIENETDFWWSLKIKKLIQLKNYGEYAPQKSYDASFISF